MFEGLDSADKDPRKSLHIDEVPIPPLGPNEVLIAPMASALNFNTVWTSIFEPLSTFLFLERFGRESELGARHNLDYHIVGSDAAAIVVRVGAGSDALEARRPRHGALQLRRSRGPRGPRRLDDGHAPAHLGLRVELRRPGGDLAGQGQPAHADADAPDVGGGRQPGAHARDQLPHARQPARCGHEAGRRRADLGRDGRARRLRGPAGRNGGGIPVNVVSSAAKVGAAALPRRRPRDRPHGRGLPVLEGRPPAAQRVEAPRRAHPRAHRRRGRRHRLRAPRPRDLRRQRLRRPPRRRGRDLRLDLRLSSTSTTTATCG